MEPVQHYIQEGILYEPVVPNIQDWPINLFFKNKKRIVKDVVAEAIDQLHAQAQQEGVVIQDYIARTMYLERIRMNEDPWKVDPKDEQKFWGGIKKALVKNDQFEGDVEAFTQANEEMLERIVSRYANEISSNFKPSSYHFAKRFLPFMFSTLLNASAGKTFMSIINHRLQLQEKVHLLGEIEAMRNLASKGTLILVPTHTSNMDSILIAWGIHALGLPAFIYGAGLNLYNHKIVSYFLTRLGAYKLDRRKRNPIYRSTLDAYSTVAIQEGVHGLFYPGGTRSRSGNLENKIKLGLLQTAIEGQRR
ncbi:MAG: 1-acyl-sn-glycerol-3-phosphate acyltransferase, partial [Bacteroidota bacterium]